MKKIVKRFLFLLFIVSILAGCNGKSDGVCPMTVKIDGKLYYCYDEVIEISNVDVLGYVTSTIDDMTKLPTEDNQSNFLLCLNQPYGILDGKILLYYSDNWHRCYLSDDIDNGGEVRRELYALTIDTANTKRENRREISISWQDSYDDVVKTYLVKKRDLEKGQIVGEWDTIAIIESDMTPGNSNWKYIDELETADPQQYEYRIDMELKDTDTFVAEDGSVVIGSNVKVCIDPGHFDIAKEVADADEYGYVEGNFVLEVALELRDVLKEKFGIDSCLTRETGTITLGGYTDEELDSAHISLRGEYAADEECDLFVSLHTNSNEEEANGYPTFFQPIAINKPIIIVNTVALKSETTMAVANATGAKLASVNYELGLAETDIFSEVSAECIGEWTQKYNDGLGGVGTVVVRTGKRYPDYYGVLRGASDADVPGMIIEHGYHSVAEVRKAAIAGDLKSVWANADATGIAYGFGFTQ